MNAPLAIADLDEVSFAYVLLSRLCHFEELRKRMAEVVGRSPVGEFHFCKP
jgi:hypothetical protein